MLRFRSPNRRPTRNYFSRREQWRLFLLIVPLGLVIIVMRQLRDPATGTHLNNLFSEGNPTSSDSNGSLEVAIRHPLGPPSPARPDRSKNAMSIESQVDRKLIATIEDNTYFRNSEQAAWFHLLNLLQTNDPNFEPNGETTSPIPVVYLQLVEQPQVYRGRIVQVSGTVREITLQKPADNQFGIDTYYRVVLQPDDESNGPIIIYSLDLPPALDIGERSASIRAAGFFFKNLSYQWQGGLGIAPVILTRTVHLRQPSLPLSSKPEPAAQAAIVQSPPNSDSDVSAAASMTTSFEDILALAGWDTERLARLRDGNEFTEPQRLETLALLRRLHTFDRASLEQWTKTSSASPIQDRKKANSSQLVRLRGRVVSVVEKSVPPSIVDRLEMKSYYECELLQGEQAGSVVIWAAQVPRAWLAMSEINQPAMATALFVREMPEASRSARALFVASRLEWYPELVDEPYVSLGQSILAAHGMDIGLLDEIVNHQPVKGAEREAFYQVLSVAGKIDADRLARLARRGLSTFAKSFQSDRESKQLQQRLMAKEVESLAAKGRFSVAPLFNEPDAQVGRLFMFDGVARRVTRINVGVGDDGVSVSDVYHRFGIDHYYEIELFTSDSQNRPLVFCVRELPEGFPMHGRIDQPVRLAGFFFKSWRYHTHEPLAAEKGITAPGSSGRPSISPLLIGRAPIVLPPTTAGDSRITTYVGTGIVLSGIFVALATLWRWRRSDRQFFDRHLAPSFVLPAGESLDTSRMHDAKVPISKLPVAHPSDADRGELD